MALIGSGGEHRPVTSANPFEGCDSEERNHWDLTLAEVKQLYYFLDGSIMAPDVRHQLWRSWGFCARHTWAHAIVECELRLRPFSTSILYDDLARRAERRLSHRWLPDAMKIRQLQPRGSCFTCNYVRISEGRHDPSYANRQRLVNARAEVARLVIEAEPSWRPRSCPVCSRGDGVVCRMHLLDGVSCDLSKEASALGVLAGRLGAFVKSMTWRGPEATPEERASWVEALGWFAGWGFAESLVGSRVEGVRSG